MRKHATRSEDDPRHVGEPSVENYDEHLLTECDAILQTLLEVWTDRAASHILDPHPELVLLLMVILLCNLKDQKDYTYVYLGAGKLCL